MRENENDFTADFVHISTKLIFPIFATNATFSFHSTSHNHDTIKK
jgi:hypothetical protein